MAYTTIDDPSEYFNTLLYTGNETARSLTFSGNSDLDVDWIWLKSRSATGNHHVYDTVRGTQKHLRPNLNSLEGSNSGTDGVTAFGSNGFTVGANTGSNEDGTTYVGWGWKKTADAGFDIVTATGNATAKTISHSLSAVPHLMIAKEKSGSVNDWTVYHHKNTAAPETDSLILNETNVTADQNTHWNDTAPTSSVFTVGTGSVVNRNSSTYVYYLFSEKKGFSRFGSYPGNGNANGTFVYTGFKPAFVLLRRTDAARDWLLHDSKRSPFNQAVAKILKPNTTAADSDTGNIDILSNGFKLLSTGSNSNASGGTYIYIAFAENPLVTSTGVPATAR